MNNKSSPQGKALVPAPRNDEEYQATFNLMYERQTRSSAGKMLEKAKELLHTWKLQHDSNVASYQAAHQHGTRIEIFYRKKLLERDKTGFYDLHHLQRGAAYYFIKKTIHGLKQWIFEPTGLKLIPGKGKHSAGDPVIKQIILDICADTRMDYHPIIEADGRWGRVVMIVQPKKQPIVALPPVQPMDEEEPIMVAVHAEQGVETATLHQHPDDIDQTLAYAHMEIAATDPDNIDQTPAYASMKMATADPDDIGQAPAYAFAAHTAAPKNAYSPSFFAAPITAAQTNKKPFVFDASVTEWTPKKPPPVVKVIAEGEENINLGLMVSSG